MTLEQMKDRRKELGYSYMKLSELSGVPLGTIQKIFGGMTSSPRFETIQALEKVLSAKPYLYDLQNSKPSTPVIRENSISYGADLDFSFHNKKQGEYTLDDYYAIPDDRRVELIDGVIYDMSSPTSFHQLIAGEIYRQVSNFIIDNNGDCMPFIAPIDVQLDEDNRTMVQPDVLIVCNPNKILSQNVFGAPDFVLEVISPGTKRKDYLTKLHKYENAGVREYWLVDPYQKTILVYLFDSDNSPTIYPIDSSVPVGIYDEKLTIKLARILKWLPA